MCRGGGESFWVGGAGVVWRAAAVDEEEPPRRGPAGLAARSILAGALESGVLVVVAPRLHYAR